MARQKSTAVLAKRQHIASIAVRQPATPCRFFGFGFGFAWRSGRFDQLFDLVEHGQLRRVGIFRAALGLGREQLVATVSCEV